MFKTITGNELTKCRNNAAMLMAVVLCCCSQGKNEEDNNSKDGSIVDGSTPALPNDNKECPKADIASINPCADGQCPDLQWTRLEGGSYLMGSHRDERPQPIHEVHISEFEMMKNEVTVAEYKPCVDAAVCLAPVTGEFCESEDSNWDKPGREKHPVNCVHWIQAEKYCAWVGGRLPSESEWEYAARSGGKEIVFPWAEEGGDLLEISRSLGCKYVVMWENMTVEKAGCGTGHTMEVCSKPDGNTEQGLCDMAGNVQELVEDWASDSYVGAPADGSAWPGPPCDLKIVRGGSYKDESIENYPAFDTTFRRAITGAGSRNGFRCAR